MLTLAARTIDRTISGRGRSWVPVQVEGPQHLINSYLTTLIQRHQSEEGRPGLAPPVKGRSCREADFYLFFPPHYLQS